ncbi:hypothetical protein DV736_g1583, partial [Chaetothyriales sp. CBS 134916]
MLATSSTSPNLRPDSSFEPAHCYPPRPQYDIRPQSPQIRSPIAPQARKHYPFPSPVHRSQRRASVRSLDRFSPLYKAGRTMVDAATQYSPPKPAASSESVPKPPASNIESLQIQELDSVVNHQRGTRDRGHIATTAAPQPAVATIASSTTPPSRPKRQASDADQEQPAVPFQQQLSLSQAMDDSPLKKSRPDAPAAHVVPLEYEFCDTRDLVILISSMIMELIRYNDAIPLKDGHLTRFHSRAPPGISVQDYLQRLTTHATLSPPILLSMVYYIDRLCALYPAFTITSLTVHRFLIASATVASKGLSDSFWTNKTYARVGGVSVKELALLELEFLTRLEWRIVPKPEVLTDYYRSLVKRSETHTFGSAEVT